MASFTAEQVFEEVCSNANSGGNSKEPECSLEEVIKRSVNNFRPLRRLLDNYDTFNVEASSCLENVFKRHESKGNNTDRVLLSRASVWPMITAEVLMWLKCINRRMLATPKARDPWCIEIKRDLPQEVFIHIKDAIRKGVSAFGVSVEDSVVKFTHRKRLPRDFSKFCGLTQSDIKTKLKKTFSGNRKNFKADVLVDEDKPFIICYDHKRMKVIVTCHYGLWNEFGYGFHG